LCCAPRGEHGRLTGADEPGRVICGAPATDSASRCVLAVTPSARRAGKGDEG